MALGASSQRTSGFDYVWEERTFKKNNVDNCKRLREEKFAIHGIYFVTRQFRYGQSILVLATRTI